MKKLFKIIGITLGVFILALFIIPILFEDEIEAKLKKTINQNLTAQVDWNDLNLSLISHFPKASLDLEALEVLNTGLFKGDTLVSSKAISLELNVWQLLTSDEIAIDGIEVSDAIINIKVDKNGNANYLITKAETNDDGPTAEQTKSSSKEPLKLALKSYSISNTTVSYKDQTTGMVFKIDHLNHNGSGNLEANVTTLNTHTDAEVSFLFGGVNYLDHNSVVLDAQLSMNFDQMKFSFLENKALINQLPLNFNGDIQILEDAQDINLSFSTPTSDFKNFLGLIPATYAGNLDGVETTGEFELKGEIKGQVTETTIPKINITGTSKDAEIKYVDLPQPITNININLAVVNTTGIVEDTYIDLSPFSFKIDEDQFSGELKVSDLTGKLNLDVLANGQINLAQLKEAYPIESNFPLEGQISSQLKGRLSVTELQNSNYNNVNLNGNLSLRGFNYNDEVLPEPVTIKKADLKFTTNNVDLDQFELTAGQSDLSANGSLNNLMGFAFNNGILKGNLNAQSTHFRVKDFLAASTTKEEETKEADKTSAETTTANTTDEAQLKIPDFLDFKLNFNANKVSYSSLDFKAMQGEILLKAGAVSIPKANTNIFGGQLTLSGVFDTKEKQPTFDFDLGFNNVDITKSLAGLDILNYLAPITNALNGQMNFDLNFNGLMLPNFDLDTQSLNGNLKAEILNAEIETEQSKLLTSLNSNFQNLKLDQLKLNDVTALLKFENGAIATQPFSFNVGDVDVTAEGSHGFNNNLAYNLDLKLPAKYLGKDANAQLAKLAGNSVGETKVNLPVSISGQLTQPQIKLDSNAAIQSLKTQIVNNQKDKLRDKISNKVGDLIDNKKTDSTSNKTEETVKKVLGGLFGKKKEKN